MTDYQLLFKDGFPCFYEVIWYLESQFNPCLLQSYQISRLTASPKHKMMNKTLKQVRPSVGVTTDTDTAAVSHSHWCCTQLYCFISVLSVPFLFLPV